MISHLDCNHHRLTPTVADSSNTCNSGNSFGASSSSTCEAVTACAVFGSLGLVLSWTAVLLNGVFLFTNYLFSQSRPWFKLLLSFHLASGTFAEVQVVGRAG